MNKSIDQQQLNNWIEAIYEAALDDSLWKPLMNQIAHKIGASECHFFSPRLTPSDQPFMLTSFEGLNTEIWKHYEDYFWQHDVWAIDAIKNGYFKQGTLFAGDQLITPSNFRNTEIFSDFFKPNFGAYDTVITLVVFDDKTPDQSPCTALNFYKPSHSESFNDKDFQLLRYLEPHLQRALHIRWKLQKKDQETQLREAALNQLNSGTLILDPKGQIVYANPLAEKMLCLGQNPTTNHGKLSSIHPLDRNAIDKAVINASKGLGSTLRFDNPQPIGARLANFAPFKSNSNWNSKEKYIFVMLSEPNKTNNELIVNITMTYGLSPAESRVLIHLLTRKSPQQIADVSGVSITTLRTQLKAIFAKTGTKNQRELVQFCLEYPNF